MKTRLLATLTISTSLFLAACGGGGDVHQEVIITKPANVTFTNVPTTRTTASPGERSVEVVAFRATWRDSYAPVQQLVFENESSGDASDLLALESVRLLANGADLRLNQASYAIRFKEKEVIVDFFGFGWQAPVTSIPQTYSLAASVKTETQVGKKIAFALTKVQMHDADASSSGFAEVQGSAMTVILIAGKELPVVTSAFSANTSNLMRDDYVQKSIEISCPSSPANTYGCTLDTIKMRANGDGAPWTYVGFWRQATWLVNDEYEFPMWVYIPPGQSMTIWFSAYARYDNVYMEVSDMQFDIGGMKVNPKYSAECYSMLPSNKGCKGKVEPGDPNKIK